MLEFGEYLKQLMDEKKIGVNELANLSGVSSSHISRIINGKRSTPSPKTIQKFAAALTVEYELLMKIAGYIDKLNPESLQSSHEKKPKDLQRILEQHELLFSGTPLTEEDKQAILDVVELQLYKRAKELNKRKKPSL